MSVKEYSSSEDESETKSSSEDSDNDQPVRPDVDETWSTELNHIHVPQFEGIPGPKHLLIKSKQERSRSFNNLFSPELYCKIALETNLYAQQMQAVNRNDPKWKDIIEEEINAYIGLRVYMSIVDLPEMKMFWSC